LFQRMLFARWASFSIIRPLPPELLLAVTGRRPENISEYPGMLL